MHSLPFSLLSQLPLSPQFLRNELQANFINILAVIFHDYLPFISRCLNKCCRTVIYIHIHICMYIYIHIHIQYIHIQYIHIHIQYLYLLFSSDTLSSSSQVAGSSWLMIHCWHFCQGSDWWHLYCCWTNWFSIILRLTLFHDLISQSNTANANQLNFCAINCLLLLI